MTTQFSPGDLVHARGREWVSLPAPQAGGNAMRIKEGFNFFSGVSGARTCQS
jgi:hypothetical protein